MLPLIATDAPDPAGLQPMVVMILVVLVLGLAVIFIYHTRGKIARRNAERGTPRQQIEAIKQRAETHGDTDRSISQMLDLSRRLAAQLQNKAQRLEQLIEQADERIALFSAMASSADNAGRQNNGNGAAPAGEKLEDLKREAGEVDQSLHDEIGRLADEGYSPVEIAQRLDEHTGKIELILALRQED